MKQGCFSVQRSYEAVPVHGSGDISIVDVGDNYGVWNTSVSTTIDTSIVSRCVPGQLPCMENDYQSSPSISVSLLTFLKKMPVLLWLFMEILPLFPERIVPRRATRTKRDNLYQPTDKDIANLWAFPECLFFSAEQLIRYVGFSPKSLPFIQERLVVLAGEGKKQPSLPYLRRMLKPIKPDQSLPRKRGGSAPFIYFLSAEGIKLLRRNGYDPEILSRYAKRVRKIMEKNQLPSELDHSLAVTELLIAAKQINMVEPRLSLYAFQHDWLLRQAPYPTKIFKGWKSQPIAYDLAPDGLIDFRLERGAHEQPIPKRVFLEMDMGTHTSRVRFQKKLAGYLDFFTSGTYARRLSNIRNYVVLFATPKGEARRDELRQWTREFFIDPLYSPRQYLRGYVPTEADKNIFRFANLPPGALDPLYVMFHPLCLLADEDTAPEPLIYLP